MKLVILDASVIAFGLGAKIGELYPQVLPRKDLIKVYNHAYGLMVDSLTDGLTNANMVELTAKLACLVNRRFDDIPTKQPGQKRNEFKAELTEWIEQTTPTRLSDFIGQPPSGFLDGPLAKAVNAIELYAQLGAMWINQLGWAPILQQHDCAVVWAFDSKPYWRSQIDPNYKGCRNAKTAQYYAAFEGINKVDDLARIELPGQEADDIAAAIVRLWLKENTGIFDQLLLGTIDSDWHGLIQSPEILWVNLKNYSPRVRNREIVFNWLCSKWNKQSKRKQALWELPDYLSFNPAHIWDWKVATGDAADNLDEGSARLMIDLLHPPKYFDPLEEKASVNTIYTRLNQAKQPLQNTATIAELEIAMLELGVTTPIDTISELVDFISL